MTTQQYLMINKSTNVVDNVCVWDGDINTWQPPENNLMLIQADTQALVWKINADKMDYVLVEVLGAGDVGFTWNETTQVLTTNQTKPPAPVQPVTTGTVTA